MRTWMIPWLFPLAILVIVAGMLISPWVGAAAVVIVVALALAGWRAYMRDGGTLPRWSGWRSPR
jgi:Flp pilus assembly protein TadB